MTSPYTKSVIFAAWAMIRYVHIASEVGPSDVSILQWSVKDPTGRCVRLATKISCRKTTIKAASVKLDVQMFPSLIRTRIWADRVWESTISLGEGSVCDDLVQVL